MYDTRFMLYSKCSAVLFLRWLYLWYSYSMFIWCWYCVLIDFTLKLLSKMMSAYFYIRQCGDLHITWLVCLPIGLLWWLRTCDHSWYISRHCAHYISLTHLKWKCWFGRYIFCITLLTNVKNFFLRLGWMGGLSVEIIIDEFNRDSLVHCCSLKVKLME